MRASPITSEPDSTNLFASARSKTDSTDNVPPVNTKVPDPNARLDPTCSAPALNRTPPEKLFEPDNVSADRPFFTSTPDPLITPLKVDAAAPPKVSVLPCSSTEPAPASAPNSSEAARFKVPPAFTLTVAEFTRALPPTKLSVPAFTATVPENVFTPDKVNSLLPPFTRFPGPLTAPVRVTALAAFNTELPVILALPLSRSAPLFTESPSVKVPSNSSALAT